MSALIANIRSACTLRVDMLVLRQNARKLDFPGKFDAVWLCPYLVGEVFANNSV